MMLCPASLLLPLPAMMQTFSGSAAAPSACRHSLQQGAQTGGVISLDERHLPQLPCLHFGQSTRSPSQQQRRWHQNQQRQRRRSRKVLQPTVQAEQRHAGGGRVQVELCTVGAGVAVPANQALLGGLQAGGQWEPNGHSLARECMHACIQRTQAGRQPAQGAPHSGALAAPQATTAGRGRLSQDKTTCACITPVVTCWKRARARRCAQASPVSHSTSMMAL